MDKKVIIGKIYKVLPIFEDSVENYVKYIKRLCVFIKGLGNDELSTNIEGLRLYGSEIDHDTVKLTVFEMVDIVKKMDI